MDEGAHFYDRSKPKFKGNFMGKYLELDQEVPYLVETLLVHPVLVQSHEKKQEIYESHLLKSR
jgi:hypothetical protein